VSLKNVMRKLTKEAKTRATEKGHGLGRFHLLEDGCTYCAECIHCAAKAEIVPALEIGVHRLGGEALEAHCAAELG